MAPGVNIERKVSGRGHRALLSPTPCRSRAYPLCSRFVHPHAAVLDRVHSLHLVDSHLLPSWRSSYARLPLRLTTILASNLAYSSRCTRDCATLAQRPLLRAMQAIRARDRSTAFGSPSVTLSALRVSVSPVGVSCDSEALHVLEIRIELGLGTLGVRLGRDLCCLQEKMSK